MATQLAIPKNPNAELTDAPEEDTEEDKPVPEITGVDQELPNDEQQDLNTPDDNQNENYINHGTKEVRDPIEDTFKRNDDLQPQEKEPEQLLDTPVPAATWRSTRLKKPVSCIVPSFTGKKYDTTATLISWEYMFVTVHRDTHMRLSQGIDYDHVVFYTMT